MSLNQGVLPAYSLCNQTISVYNILTTNGKQQYMKTVISNGAFFDYKRSWQEQKTGSVGETSCLLIIPQNANGKAFVVPSAYTGKPNTYTLDKNHKVCLGIGADIENTQQWAQFIPSKVDGLIVIQHVDPKYYNGQIIHIEAGG